MKAVFFLFFLFSGVVFANEDSNLSKDSNVSESGLSKWIGVGVDLFGSTSTVKTKYILTNNGYVTQIDKKIDSLYVRGSLDTFLGTFSRTLVDSTQTNRPDAKFREFSYSPVGIIWSAKKNPQLSAIAIPFAILGAVYKESITEDEYYYGDTKYIGLLWGFVGKEDTKYRLDDFQSSYVQKADSIEIRETKIGIRLSKMFETLEQLYSKLNAKNVSGGRRKFFIIPYFAYDIYSIETEYRYTSAGAEIYSEKGSGIGYLYGGGYQLWIDDIFNLNQKGRINLYSTAYYLTGVENIKMESGLQNGVETTNELTQWKFSIALNYSW